MASNLRELLGHRRFDKLQQQLLFEAELPVFAALHPRVVPVADQLPDEHDPHSARWLALKSELRRVADELDARMQIKRAVAEDQDHSDPTIRGNGSLDGRPQPVGAPVEAPFSFVGASGNDTGMIGVPRLSSIRPATLACVPEVPPLRYPFPSPSPAPAPSP